jgi:hypothetical protein
VDEFWWGLIWLTLFIPLMFLWGFALWDILSRNDLRGWEKALWAIAIVFFPLIGLLVYFIARPKQPDAFGGYAYGSAYGDPYGSGFRYPAGYQRASGPAPDANDIETLSRMRDSGTLTNAEYDELKQRLSSQERGAA